MSRELLKILSPATEGPHIQVYLYNWRLQLGKDPAAHSPLPGPVLQSTIH